MFDLGGFDAPTTGSILYPLPEVEEVTRREMLDWEKELVGVYVSEHPMQPFINSLRDTVTCFLGQLDETMAGHKVTVAGMVNWVRQIYTKNGKPMAFVELEDVQGVVELVVFPRVYEGTREMWKEGKVVVVRGQVDTKGGNEPKIICEMVDDTIPRTQPATSQGLGNQDSGIRESGIRYQVSGNQADANLIPDSRSPYHLQITVNRTGNPAHDKERLRTVYKLVTHYQGNDTFSLFIPNGKRRVQLDFPNATTCHCVELQQKLTEILGATAVRVERQDGE
jgi:DNA polymerase-3 subunit alpha